MNFHISEEVRHSFRAYPTGQPLLDPRHVFMAAVELLREEYAGGGIFHILDLLPPQMTWNEVRKRISESQETYAVPVPGQIPPGWRPPRDQEFAELYRRHRTKALARGTRATTVYEVLYDCLQSPRVKELLASVGWSAEELSRRVEPYLDMEKARAELEVTRWEALMLGLRPPGGGFLEPAATAPAAVYRLSGPPRKAMDLAQDTVTFSLLLLAGLQQAFRGGRSRVVPAGAQPPSYAVLGPLAEAIEKDLTGGLPLSQYAVGREFRPGEVVYWKVPLNFLKVAPTVEQFLYHHRDIAMQRGQTFTTYKEVLLDLLEQPEILELLVRVGYPTVQVQGSIEALEMPQ